jgi:HYDIN/CFA65/VesB-like, Ig-like domain
VDPMAIAGWYPAGMASGETALFTLPQAQAQVMDPQPNAGAQLSFDPGAGPFGFWSTWPYWGAYHIYQEDVFNIWDPPPEGILHHMRIYPFKDPDGTLEPNAFVVTTEETYAKVGPDYNDLIFIVRNVVPAPGMSGSLRFDNLDAVPASDWMVFSTFGSVPTCQEPVTDKSTGTLQIQNLGNGPIDITSVTTTDTFTATPAQVLPATIAAGGSLDVVITFNATSELLHRGMLAVTTSDPAAPTHTVTLSGVFQVHPQQPGEPRPDQIFNGIFGFTTTILGPGQDCYVLNTDPQCGGKVQSPGFEIAIGDEVMSPYWAKADATRPVAARQIGSWHSGYDCPNQVSYGSSFGWWVKGMPPLTSTQFTLAGALEDVQRVLPRTRDHSGPNYATFDPGAASIGFRVENELSDDSLQQQEPFCTPAQKCGHRMRFWPVKNSAGTPVPNSYVMTIDWHVPDFSTSNYDYNDEVYLIDNIRPVDVIGSTDGGMPVGPPDGGS